MSISPLSGVSHRDAYEVKSPEGAAPPQSPNYLPDCPPLKVWERSIRAFETIPESPHFWREDGRKEYHLAGVFEDKLIKKMIEESPNQKIFNIVELGEGDGTWSRGIAKKAKNWQLPQDVTINLFGTRGGQLLYRPKFRINDREVTQVGQHFIHTLGSFLLEDLEQEFLDRHLDLKGRVDLFISSWALRHTANPMAIFKAMMDMLAPNRMCIFDGFFFQIGEEFALGDNNFYMNVLLQSMRVSYVTLHFTTRRSLNHYVVQKDDSLEPCRIPLRYQGDVTDLGERRIDITSRSVTRFEFCNISAGIPKIYKMPSLNYLSYRLFGDKQLHENLRQNGLIENDLAWAPLTREAFAEKTPCLHTAAQYGDIPCITMLLENGFDLNESDYLGRTLLHIAVESDNIELVRFLLNQEGIIFDLANVKNKTPLMLATQSGKVEIAALLEAHATWTSLKAYAAVNSFDSI